MYADNPQREAIELQGTSHLPNLHFEASTVDFGSCLSDTTQRQSVRVVNSGAVDVAYAWAWDAASFKVSKCAAAASPLCL